jgi:ABC-2 type transport system ATP-binding protein
VQSVQVEDHGCTAELDGDETEVQSLLDQLVSSKTGVVSFADKEPTLEDVFMMVTKGLVS